MTLPANVKTIKSIPHTVSSSGLPAYFIIRGEIYIPRMGFDKMNAERSEQGEALFANPRNAASGTIKLLDPKQVAARPLECFLYYLLGENLPADNHYDNLMEARRWGFRVSEIMEKCRNTGEIINFHEEVGNSQKDVAL